MALNKSQVIGLIKGVCGSGGGSSTPAAPSEVVILPEMTLTVEDGSATITTPWETEFPAVNKTYTVTYNGTDYQCTAMTDPENPGCTLLGNLAVLELTGGNPDAPFAAWCVPNNLIDEMGCSCDIYPGDDSTTVTVSITGEATSSGGNAGGGSSAPVPVVILPETTLEFDQESGIAFILTPLSAVPAEGATAKIVYNGVEYTSPVLYNADEGNFSCVMGNTEAIGVQGGNPDAPFLVALSPDGPEVYGMVMPMDGSTTVTMSIICEAESSNSDTSDYVIRATIDVEADTITTTQKWTKVVAATRAGRNVRICAVAGATHLMYYCYAYTYPTTELYFFSAPLMGTTIVRYKAERAADDSIVITVTKGLD